jgi:hypothetical protein
VKSSDSSVCFQDSNLAGQLAPLATTVVELPAADKLTLFAPSDAAFKAAGALPQGDGLVTVSPKPHPYSKLVLSKPVQVSPLYVVLT